MNNNEFKEYIKTKFGDNIIYEGEYKSIRKTPKLVFHCLKEDHDEPFIIRTEWLFRKNCKNPCPFCNGKYNEKIVKKILKEKFGNNITLISPWIYGETDMLNSDLIFNCKKHGNFTEKLNNVLHYKYGCSKCAYTEANKRKHIKPINDLKNLLDKYNIYFFDSDYINANTPMNFYKDGKIIFKRSPGKILYDNKLNYYHSTGENFIASFLDEKNIEYIQEKKFDDLVYITNLRYDFYIPKYNCAIEYDGTQHFDKSSFFYDEDSIKRDALKNKYAKEHNIRLLRIEKLDHHRLGKKKKEILKIKIINFLTSSTTIEKFEI